MGIVSTRCPYEIVAALGAGGMGEVYRATDAKLKRDVAIKVLPSEFTADKDRLARFERETQILAQLNHPNIAHIYGLETSGESHALVLELVAPGDTNLPNPSVVSRRIACWTRDPRASLGLTEPLFPKFLLSTAFIVPPFSRESSVYFRWTTTPGHSCRAACPGATTIDDSAAPSSGSVRGA